MASRFPQAASIVEPEMRRCRDVVRRIRRSGDALMIFHTSLPVQLKSRHRRSLVRAGVALLVK